MKKFMAEFKAFAMRGNVLDMAVGVIIGGAFGKITTSTIVAWERNQVFCSHKCGLLIGYLWTSTIISACFFMFITDYQRETRNFVEMAGNAKNLLKPDKMWTYICVFRGLHKIHKLVHKNQSIAFLIILVDV